MGAHLAAEDVNLLDCTDNGISAGEQSEIALRGWSSPGARWGSW